jgi:hypothetical protein
MPLASESITFGQTSAYPFILEEKSQDIPFLKTLARRERGSYVLV